jgi:hypothetical protein
VAWNEEGDCRVVYACLICKNSKIEQQKPSSLMQPSFVPDWKWDSISMDFVGALPKIAKSILFG